MKVDLIPSGLIDQLRAWFHPKDRSVFIAEDCFIDMDEQSKPSTNPATGRDRLYPKAGNNWYVLDSAGVETLLGGGGGLPIHDHSDNTQGGQNLHSVQELEFDEDTGLTINAGAVTRTQVYHNIDTQAAAATDDLDTINGGTEADVLFTRQTNDARDIKYTTSGNLKIPSGIDLYSDLSSHLLGFLYDGQNWLNFANPFGRWSLIAETVLGASAASITFATIPQTFRALFLSMNLRTDFAAEIDGVTLQFNADGGANYDYQWMGANDTTPGSNGFRGQTKIEIGVCEAANSSANAFSSFGIYIWNYTNNNTFKTISGLNSGAFGNVSADTDCFIRSAYGKWRSTNAIATASISPFTGPNFVANCVAQLYGIL